MLTPEARQRVFNPMVRPRRIGCSGRFWYPHGSADGIAYVTLDAATGSRAPSFNPAAAVLRDSTREHVAAERLPLSSLSVGGDGTVAFVGFQRVDMQESGWWFRRASDVMMRAAG